MPETSIATHRVDPIGRRRNVEGVSAMAVTIECSDCGRVYQLAADAGFAELECSCGRMLRVPGATGSARAHRGAEARRPSVALLLHAVAIVRRVLPWLLAIGAGAAVAIASSSAIDLSHVFWMVTRPLVPAWAWFAAPVASVAVLALALRRRRPGGLAAAAAIIGAAFIAQLLFLAAAKLSIDHRAVLREHAWIGWPLVFPMIGALSGLAAVAGGHLLRRPLRIERDHHRPAVLRAGAGAVGLLSGVVMYLGVIHFPSVSAVAPADLTPEVQAAMMTLFGVVTATLAVAATDIARTHDAGGAPVLLAILGTIIGVMIHEVLGLEPPWAFVSLLALPIALGLAGLAVGVLLSTEGRPRQFAIAGLVAGALALAGGAYWMHPTPEALHARALIRSAQNDEGQREAAIEELGTIDHPGAIRVLIRALGDDDPQVVAAAATALGTIGDRRAIRPLAKLLDGPDPNVQRMARNALIRIGGAEVVTVFADRLSDDETPDWEAAARALAWMGEDGLPALLALARDERSSRRSLAVALLARSGDPEVAERVLLEALHDPDSSVRSSAIHQLGTPEYRWMFERVAEMARSEDLNVRSPAIAAIAGMADPRGTQILIDALFEGRTLTAHRAAAALATICTPEALEALERALESDDTTTMNAAAGAYARVYGEDAAEILIALLRRGVAGEGPELSTQTLSTIAHRLPPDVFVALLTDDEEDIRDGVMLAVESICRGHPERIEHYLAHDDADVRLRAVRIYLMREVGGDPIRTIPLLGDPSEDVRERTATSLARYAAEDHTIAVEALRHPDPSVVAKAARIVGEAEVAGAADALLRLLRGDETECASEAALALGKLGEERAIEPLIEALGAAPGPVRAAAADALGMLRARDAIEELIASLSDVNQQVRSNAAGALAAIGRPAISALGEAATSGDPWVRGGAINALSRIDDPRAEATLERVREPRRDVPPSSSAIPPP